MESLMRTLTRAGFALAGFGVVNQFFLFNGIVFLSQNFSQNFFLRFDHNFHHFML